MEPLSGNAMLIAAAALLPAAAVLVAAVWLLRARARGERDLHDLREQLGAALEDPTGATRIHAGGRDEPFVGIASSLNRLLDRVDEQRGAGADQRPLFQALAATSPEVVLIHSESVLFANAAAARLLELDADALVGKPFVDLLRPAYRAMIRKRIASLLDSDEPLEPIEAQLSNTDDRGLWAELHSSRIDYRGEPAFLTVARDITHKKSLEATLGRGKLQTRLTLESIGEGIITTDTAGVIDYMNPAAEQLIGVTRSTAVGKRLLDLVALVDESDRQSLGDPVEQCLAERRAVNLGRRAFLTAKLSAREMSVELTAYPNLGPDRSLIGCVVVFHDVTELRGQAKAMSYQASHDALTGLVNRAEFERRLDGALEGARLEGTSHVVCYLDLDRFKVVNDTCGHSAGDKLLREIASLIREQVRDSDTVARVGGDEFAMLLVGCPLDKARQIGDDVCRVVAEYPFAWQNRSFEVGVSIGLVEVGQASRSAEDVLRAADSACYVAKQQGRGRVHVYSAKDEMLARQRGEIQWLQRLQSALNDDGFELYAQPIVAVTGRVESGPAAELLIRLKDESGKPLAPAQFLAAAERYHLMGDVDRWVVRAALTAVAAGTPRLPEGRSCGINLSGQSLVDEEFLGFVVDLLDHTGVDPDKLCFEVNEAQVLRNVGRAQRFINVLHGIGCRFAMDNFGSGVGSLANLRQLSLDYLKVDGVCTRNLEQDKVNRQLIAALVNLSRELGFRLVAEHVEDQSTFEALRELGVEFVQGYVVERPRGLH